MVLIELLRLQWVPNKGLSAGPGIVIILPYYSSLMGLETRKILLDKKKSNGPTDG